MNCHWEDFHEGFIAWRNIRSITSFQKKAFPYTYHSLVHHCCLCSHHTHCILPTVEYSGNWFYSWIRCGYHTDRQDPLKHKRELSKNIVLLLYAHDLNIWFLFYGALLPLKGVNDWKKNLSGHIAHLPAGAQWSPIIPLPAFCPLYFYAKWLGIYHFAWAITISHPQEVFLDNQTNFPLS